MPLNFVPGEKNKIAFNFFLLLGADNIKLFMAKRTSYFTDKLDSFITVTQISIALKRDSLIYS